MPEPRLNTAPAASESWLEVIDSNSPLLLIAPHGGRAEPRTRSMLNPKVNDLHTADITRGLAARLGASALINVAMDRNRLDCNRLSQIIERAPWLLEMIADRVGAIVERHGRVTVLLIHGWNIIEPRLDFGLGLRTSGSELRPPGSACVSACDDFINGPLAGLADRLHGHGIKPTYGMRYPGGGLQNLLQAFTARHRESPHVPLRTISEIAMRGAVDAAQLELSVALRMPGELRTRCEDAIAEVFSGNGNAHVSSSPIAINRAPRPAVPKSEIGAAATVASPGRVGIEFYDPAAHFGAMASFDVGGAGMGARIMMLFDHHRAALFTAEGRPTPSANAVTHGPLSLRREGESIVLAFRGPAVIVPDATAYLSIERALASGRLDGDAEVDVCFEIDRAGGEFHFDRILASSAASQDAPSSSAAFGRIAGRVRIDGVARTVNGFARAGMSFTGLGPQKFTARRMLWVSFDDEEAPRALEARSVATGDAPPNQSARILGAGGWSSCRLRDLTIETLSVEEPPHRIFASLIRSDGSSCELEGTVECFIPLSRPGPGQSRIYTTLGFAIFRDGTHRGAGMFEYSRVADSVLTAADENDDSDSD
ncbi:MAG TPA: hypothetical protein VJX68_02465 [Candidatus Binatus sp.]|uniref:hypothetical protein n=1 Tax=Candidatus Binatus sp. TaxID=2811406 RepID=UPI002B4911B0|nr:hypothetical protein [Candidatus Binatus sp.]HKN12033.1 hypothetical protein [Candidatus Binatus sp.]